ncbi:MAG: enoyl-CoA hydratase-related protein, partial [Crocinitomicaceae bacterium]
MSTINWKTVKEYEDITFKVADGVARIAFNRPEVRNAFRPKTVDELLEALIICHEHEEVGVVLITGEGPSPKDGGWAFCSGGDQKARGHKGYVGDDGYHRLNILEVQRLIRFMPKA